MSSATPRVDAAQERAASPPASGASGFDFLIGDWRVENRKLKKRLTRSNDWFEFSGRFTVRPILDGAGNMDDLVLDDPNGRQSGSSIRLFDRATKTWSIYWIDASSPTIEPPAVGAVVDGVATLFGEERFEGRIVGLRYVYRNLSPQNASWEQAYSDDGGKSWEINWVMNFTRIQSQD